MDISMASPGPLRLGSQQIDTGGSSAIVNELTFGLVGRKGTRWRSLIVVVARAVQSGESGTLLTVRS
jgi:hypothetical protein